MKNKFITILLVVMVILLLSAIGFFGYYLTNTKDANGNSLLSKITNEAPFNPIQKNIIDTQHSNNSKIGFIKEMDELIMNLDVSKKNSRNYLRIKINFELTNEDDEKLFDNYEALIFDKVLSICSSKSKEELMSIGGKDDLKEELKNNINRSLPSNIIKNIYFREFVIQ